MGLISNCRIWLGTRNDYRTLIEADILDIVEIDINDSDKEGNDG